MFFKFKISLHVSLLGVFLFQLWPLFVNSFMLEDRSRAKLRQASRKLRANLMSNVLDVTGAISGSPLSLSPFIERGDYAQAEKEATVPPFLPGVESFSGFITVNKTCKSNLFFWMFKSFEGDWKTKPLIIWLQGGPGVSSMLGLFREIGPYYLDAQGKLYKRKYPWNQKYNLMFIDNPTGTGFSYTKLDSCYANSDTDVAEDLYTFIVQFYAMFPALGRNPLFIMGESYAGKYVPAFAHYIHRQNQKNKGKGLVVPLKGAAIGNGFTDPLYMLPYGDLLYQLGFIDRSGRAQLYRLEDETKALIRAGDYLKADEVGNGKLYDAVYNLTGLISLYHYINDDVPLDGSEEAFLNEPATRRALHVGNQRFEFMSDKVYEYLKFDIMQSSKPLIEDILNWEAFDFVSYSGQLDIICAYPLSENMHYNLKWKRAADYKKAKRCQYEVGGRTEGYFKTAGVFTEIMLRNCGHMVPTDCPEVGLNFLDRFVTNTKGFKCV